MAYDETQGRPDKAPHPRPPALSTRRSLHG